mgnify:FL=1
MDPIVQSNGILRLCCADLANLERVAERRDPVTQLLRWHDRCKVCGRNHRGMEVEPPAVGARLAAA